MAIKFHHHRLTNLNLRKTMRQNGNGQVNDNELMITLINIIQWWCIYNVYILYYIIRDGSSVQPYAALCHVSWRNAAHAVRTSIPLAMFPFITHYNSPDWTAILQLIQRNINSHKKYLHVAQQAIIQEVLR